MKIAVKSLQNCHCFVSNVLFVRPVPSHVIKFTSMSLPFVVFSIVNFAYENNVTVLRGEQTD